MARKPKHEEHTNHEAWAIPYGDLVTLLLALFVVMYAMSSVNEGKFRVLSDSLIAAFRGAPKTITPISVGQNAGGKGGEGKLQGIKPTMLLKLPSVKPVKNDEEEQAGQGPGQGAGKGPGEGFGGDVPPLTRMAEEVQKAMQTLIDKNLVVVRQNRLTLEVEIRTDILFSSGVSTVSDAAIPVLKELSDILKPFPNAVRVEGHTDNVPIKSREFPSNWELSAARAASVVHLFMKQGIDPARLEIIGLGEYRPVADNKTLEGRNTNRRVVVVILENAAGSDANAAAATGGGLPATPTATPGSTPAPNTPPATTVLVEPKK